MARLIILAILLIVLVGIAGAFLVSALLQGKQERADADRQKDIESLNSTIHDIAFDHLDVHPALARAVLGRFELGVKYPQGHTADEIPADILRLCIEHHETDPDLSVILSDTIRLRGFRLNGTRQIG